jgi:hypothetical protein
MGVSDHTRIFVHTIATGPSSSSGFGGAHFIKGSSSIASHMMSSSACKLSTGSLGVSRTKKDSHSSESNGSLCWSSRSEKKTASSSFCQMLMRPSGTLYLERPRRKTQAVDLENFCLEGLSNPLPPPRRGLLLLQHDPVSPARRLTCGPAA